MKINLILEKINPIRMLFKNPKTLIFDCGQLKSAIKGTPVDCDGNKIPWYTYPAIEFLGQLDFSDKSVFEYGSGNSSFFWAKRAKELISVDDDEKWHKLVSKEILLNQKIVLLKNREEYSNFIKSTNKKFDIIIIDAKYRMDCAKSAKDSLNSGGMIILDNSDWYPDVAKYIREQNFIQVDFAGFGPINSYTWVTSIFFSREYNFKPINKQPQYCIGGIKQYAKNQD
ncbi:MAG TPA: SAM-dependent methyltransferase [Candidatus Moranbacteria bacterium]|nr:SAM-dependent methyltransferase [Candidatus Moranbacteria bacterium]